MPSQIGIISIADVMELVDMLDLGSSASRRAGSIPVIRTLARKPLPQRLFLFFAYYKKQEKKQSEYQREYHYTITLAKKNYEQPKLFIPKTLVKGKKVPTIAPGKRWYVYFRFNRKHYKFYKGLNDFKTVSDRRRAGKVLIEVYTEMLHRGWSPETKKIDNKLSASMPTLQLALQNALIHKKNTLKESTFSQYQTAYNRFMEWCKSNFFAGLRVDQFKRKQFAQYLNYLSDEGNNPTSINNNKRAISALFSKLVADFVIEVNPVAGIVTETSKPLKNRPFTAKQFENIIKKCND